MIIFVRSVNMEQQILSQLDRRNRMESNKMKKLIAAGMMGIFLLGGTISAFAGPPSVLKDEAVAMGPGSISGNQTYNPWDGEKPTLSEPQKLADAAEKTEKDETYIVVSKYSKTLYLMKGTEVQSFYPVIIGQREGFDKVQEGDMVTPEGEFYICEKRLHDRFHKSLDVSYPMIEDAERGYRDGLITEAQRNSIIEAINKGEKPNWYTALGGAILIHGEAKNGLNYTAGCIQMKNDDIDKIWPVVEKGCRLFIYR